MLRWLVSLPLVAIVLATPAVSQSEKQDAKDKKTGLVKGEDLPGPFHPYNVTGPRADRYHCLVTHNSLDPIVMLVVRDLDFTSPLKALEMELDNRIAKNPNVRLGSFTVVLSDDLPKVVEDDDKREELAKKLTDLANALVLKNVVLCLDSKPNLAHYALDENTWATVILVNKYKVVSIHPLSKEALNEGKVKEIIDEVASELGAKRK